MLAERIDNKEQRYFLTREQEYLAGLNAAVGIWCAPPGPRREHAAAHSLSCATHKNCTTSLLPAAAAPTWCGEQRRQLATLPARRRLMRDENYSLEDGIDMRTLLFCPGGLELHIGVGGTACVASSLARPLECE
jgi:hypothetical protein